MPNTYQLPSREVMQERAEAVAQRFPGDMSARYAEFLMKHFDNSTEIDAGAPLIWFASTANDFLQIGNRLAGHTVTIMYRSQINTLFSDASDEWRAEAIRLFDEVMASK